MNRKVILAIIGSSIITLAYIALMLIILGLGILMFNIMEYMFMGIGLIGVFVFLIRLVPRVMTVSAEAIIGE